jgi:hypothetical protein
MPRNGGAAARVGRPSRAEVLTSGIFVRQFAGVASGRIAAPWTMYRQVTRKTQSVAARLTV